MKTTLLQAAADSDFGLDIFKLLMFLTVTIIVFLVLRALALWYWKIDVIVANQQEQINQSQKMIDQQNVIIENLLALNKQSKQDSDTPSAI